MSSNSTPVYDRTIAVPAIFAGAALGGIAGWALCAGIPNVSAAVKSRHHRVVFGSMAVGALAYNQYAKRKQARLAAAAANAD